MVVQIGLSPGSLILSFEVSDLTVSRSNEVFIMVIVFFSAIINFSLALCFNLLHIG